jgi:hypothetical protein
MYITTGAWRPPVLDPFRAWATADSLQERL